MTAPKTAPKTRTRKPPAKAAAPKPAPAAPKAAPAEVSYVVERVAGREPSEVNKAEAAWLIQVAKLDIEAMTPVALAEKMVQLVAGTAHRAWQQSATAATVHSRQTATKRTAQ